MGGGGSSSDWGAPRETYWADLIQGHASYLDTAIQRDEFLAKMAGKRILHVKGCLHSDLKSREIRNQESVRAFKSLHKFAPEYIVIDADAWGNGFQVHIQNYVKHEVKAARSGNAHATVPTLVWAQVAKLDEDGVPEDNAESDKYKRVVAEWLSRVSDVTVFWIDRKSLDEKMQEFYGSQFCTEAAEVAPETRGLFKVLHDPRPVWALKMVGGVEDSIAAIETADAEMRYFDKQSLENAAKSVLIYESFHQALLKSHGVLSLGGEPSIALACALKYLNKSADDVHWSLIAIHAFQQESESWVMPHQVGSAFTEMHRLNLGPSAHSLGTNDGDDENEDETDNEFETDRACMRNLWSADDLTPGRIDEPVDDDGDKPGKDRYVACTWW